MVKIRYRDLPTHWKDKIREWSRQKMPREMIQEFLRKEGYDVKSLYSKDKPKPVAQDPRKNYRPPVSAVYLLVQDNEIVYVGQSVDLFRRLDAHHYGFGSDVYYIETPKKELTNLEKRLIRRFNPKFNNGFDYKATKVLLDDLPKLL